MNQAKKTYEKKTSAIKKFLLDNKHKYTQIQYLHMITPDVLKAKINSIAKAR